MPPARTCEVRRFLIRSFSRPRCGAMSIVEIIGLNAQADNMLAVAVYQRLSFETVFAYDEMVLRRVSSLGAPVRRLRGA